MTYLIIILVSVALFVGFRVLTGIEKRRGLRVAGNLRNRLDAKTKRGMFVATHVDWGAFLREMVIVATQRIAHDVAHTVLLIVRTLERLLTRFVRYLRERRGTGPLPEAEESTRLERAASYIRDALSNARSVKIAKKKKEG